MNGRTETVEEFLARGGEVKKIPEGESSMDMSGWRDSFRNGFIHKTKKEKTPN